MIILNKILFCTFSVNKKSIFEIVTRNTDLFILFLCLFSKSKWESNFLIKKTNYWRKVTTILSKRKTK
jgi:hypothetical protein